jgi:arginine decarboxylase
VLAATHQRPAEKLAETVHGLLDVLGPIERFWAFPGTHLFAKARRLFAAGKYDRFAALVTGIFSAMATGTYRNGAAGDFRTDDEAWTARSTRWSRPAPTGLPSRC